MSTITITYNPTTTRAEFAYGDIDEGDIVVIELGPTVGPEVTVAALDSMSVDDVEGGWDQCEKAFYTPTNEPLDVEVSVAAAMKKIKLDIKPNGGLPGDSPI